MDKMEYLNKIFSRTKGKNFENYVITQIWTKIEEYGLYPVTQQYVKRKNGYALIDLYFPQIKFAIEVDEFSHEKNEILDKIRMDEIFSSVDGIESERIKEGNYTYVKEQINTVVNKIIEKVKQSGPFKWEETWQEAEYKETFDKIRERKKLLCSDVIGFTKIQVTNDIFKKNWSNGYFSFGKSYFELTQNERLWFPHLTPNKKWKNYVSDDWSVIYEENLENRTERQILGDDHNQNIKRYTFAKYKNAFGETSYRFIGVFKFREIENITYIYEKISDELELV